jgi:hypothetical protein
MNLALGGSMRDADHPKLDELERLLNDPEVPLQAARVWELLAEISGPSDIQGGPVDALPLSAA